MTSCKLLARIFALCILCVLPLRVAAFDPLAANIEENIAEPAVQPKHSVAVAAAMNNLLRTLRNAGYSSETVRSGEVVLVTVPAARLFAPNAVTLSDGASAVLAPLVPYIKRTDNYKIVIAMHSDNTGDELYAERLTADRVNAVDEYFFKACGNNDTGIIPYGLGSDEPVAPNTGIANREKNRRLEIYFIPTETFIDKAKKARK